MSRIIVKNLPKYMTAERVREHFGEKGELTDCKLVYAADGTFRRFAYLGFKDPAAAQSAIEYFDRTFVDTTRISVEAAKAIGDPTLPRAWSRFSKGSSAWAEANPDEARQHRAAAAPGAASGKPSKPAASDAAAKRAERKKRLLDALFAAKSGSDAKLHEYLQAFSARHTSRTWANDTDTGNVKAIPKAANHGKDTKGVPDDDEYQDLPEGRPALELDAEDRALLTEGAPDADAAAEDAALVAADAAAIGESGRLFVRNLPFGATEAEVRALFARFGPIAELHMPIVRETKHARGFAFVLFAMPEHAVAAFAALHHCIFQGRILDIVPSREKPDAADRETAGGSELSFREKKALREARQRDQAFSWNALFMNSDAVAEATARKLGVDKLELLDPEADNMAVRLALAETQIIQEAKTYLESQGVSLSAFERPAGRSDTVVLVKNVPYAVERDELVQMFGAFGPLNRVVLPPTRTIALVEFAEPADARTAFRRLYMRKLHHLPLKLEWAPMRAFEVSGASGAAGASGASEEAPKAEEAHKDDQENAVSLFVKNLAFSTTEEQLAQAFARCAGFKRARVAQKTRPDGTRLSTGFGFVEFDDRSAAARALQCMQGHVLDDHALKLKISDKSAAASREVQGSQRAAAAGASPPGTKIAVRNIPFQATEREIRALFNPYGQVKSVRLPRKQNRELRGFGFVTFVTKAEAQAAFDALHATHLYGRHLVLEWAEDDESVEGIRKRTTGAALDDVGSGRRQAKRLKVVSEEVPRDGSESDSE